MKVIVSDYDGTFYIDEDDIKKNINSVNSFIKDNMFIIATGRSYYDFEIVKNLYHINCNYLIINHGATILKGNSIIYNNSIDNKIKNSLIIDLDLENVTNFFGCSGLESRLDLNCDNLTKINVKYNSIDKCKQIYKHIISKYYDSISVFYVYEEMGLEIVSKSVNKSKAINKILKLENINKKDIYTIGNGYSDIDMIKDFNGYCIKESIKEVKQYSKKELNSVSELIELVINMNK